MKNLLLLIPLLFLSISCRDLSGNLEVFDTLTLLKGDKEYSFEKDNYKSKLKYKSKKKIKLYIDGKKFTFRIPSKNDFPRENGTFKIYSKDLRQPYDLKGRVETEKERGDTIETYQTCTIARPYTYCTTTSRGTTFCSVRYRTYPGRRHVVYHDLKTTKELDLDLRTPGTSDVIATFKGKDVRRKKVYETKGLCY